jgi:hypothetical protein
MIFLQPLALLGLAFALIPPLLHLFQRRRPPDVVFPAARYLRETARDAQRAIRLRHLLLMLLRVAAVVLLVLAAARPVVPVSVGGLHAPTALAIVLDHSLSSGAVIGGRRVVDDLAQRARETLRETREGDAVWLVGADGLARRGSARELAEATARLQPDARRLDLVAATALAARLVRGSGYAAAEVHLLTDLQRSALGDAPGRSADSAALGVPLLVYHPAAAPPPNRGVAEARAEPATWILGGGSVTGRVAGAPVPAAPRTAVTVLLAGREVGRTVAAPGDAFAVRVAALRPGWHAGAAELEPDELRGDDRRPFAVRVAEPAAVAVEAGADLGRFVSDALAVLAGAGQLRVAGSPGVRPSGGDVRLGETARAGGGIVFPPHDRLQVGAANRALDAAGTGWRFGAAVERADTVEAPGLAGGGGFGGARVARRYRLEPTGGVVRRTVLVRVGGEPWIVRGGRTVVVGSRFVPEETDLPLSAGFVPALAGLVLRAARGDEGIVGAAPGDVVTLPEDVTALATADGPVRVAGGTAVAAPAAPGVYPLLSGADTVGALVVAPDPRESDLTRASDRDVAAAFPGAKVRVVDSPRAYAAARFAGAGQGELTPWLLVAALAVLVVESLVAAGAGRRAA